MKKKPPQNRSFFQQYTRGDFSHNSTNGITQDSFYLQHQISITYKLHNSELINNLQIESL